MKRREVNINDFIKAKKAANWQPAKPLERQLRSYNIEEQREESRI